MISKSAMDRNHDRESILESFIATTMRDSTFTKGRGLKIYEVITYICIDYSCSVSFMRVFKERMRQ